MINVVKVKLSQTSNETKALHSVDSFMEVDGVLPGHHILHRFHAGPSFFVLFRHHLWENMKLLATIIYDRWLQTSWLTVQQSITIYIW